MTKRPHERYSTEFKLHLVQTCFDEGVSIKRLAAAQGIGAALLRLWIEKYSSGELT